MIWLVVLFIVYAIGYLVCLIAALRLTRGLGLVGVLSSLYLSLEWPSIAIERWLFSDSPYYLFKKDQ